MPRSPNAERPHRQDDTIQKVAFLYAEGVPQKRIASLLSLSPSMVSRLVDQARGEQLLKETVQCLLPKKEQERLREEVFESEKLLKKLRKLAYDAAVPSLTHLRIIPTGLEIEGDHSWDQAVVVFGHKAAALCLELILKCRLLGVTYGRTLAAIANGLEQLSTVPFKTKTPVTCIPLWGEPLSPWEKPTSTIFRDPAKLSSSGLAAAMHAILNERAQRRSERSSPQQPLGLDFVPAFRPDRYPKEKFDAVLEFACSVSSYADIFPVPEEWPLAGPPREGRKRSRRQRSQSAVPDVGQRPLVDHLDAILTSAGSKDQPGRFWSGEFFRQGDIDLTRLRRGALGDLGGSFIVDPEANKADRDYVSAVNRRWTGIKETQFRRCAVRARENDLPGVVVLVVGAVRAEIALQCIKLGLVNHLVLDTHCAQQLSSLL